MSTISLRIPKSLHKVVREIAEKEHTSINQLIASALAEKISALTTEDYLTERAAKASKKKFMEAMSKVSDKEPEETDKL